MIENDAIMDTSIHCWKKKKKKTGNITEHFGLVHVWRRLRTLCGVPYLHLYYRQVKHCAGPVETGLEAWHFFHPDELWIWPGDSWESCVLTVYKSDGAVS